MEIMKTTIIVSAILCGLNLLAAGCEEKKAIGEPCVADQECDNGFCLDLSVFDEGCRGRVCTRGCVQATDCPPAVAEPGCKRFGSRSLCFYGAWQKQRCR